MLAGTEQLSSPPGWAQRWCRCMRWCLKRRQSNLWDSFLQGLEWCSDSLSGGSPVCPSSWVLKASQWRTLSVPLSHACHTAPYGRYLQGWARTESARISAIPSAGTRGDVSFNLDWTEKRKLIIWAHNSEGFNIKLSGSTLLHWHRLDIWENMPEGAEVLKRFFVLSPMHDSWPLNATMKMEAPQVVNQLPFPFSINNVQLKISDHL